MYVFKGVVFVALVLFCVVSGDILIFMPGQEDIEVTCELIAGNYYNYKSNSNCYYRLLKSKAYSDNLTAVAWALNRI